MDDMLNMPPAEGAQDAGAEPMTPPPADLAAAKPRRRRTERNAANYEEAAAIANAVAENGGEMPPEILARIQPETVAEPEKRMTEFVPSETNVVAPIISEAETMVPADESGSAMTPPADTTRHVPFGGNEPRPVQGGTTQVPRFQTRYNPPVPGNIPSQGVPRPAALKQQPQRPIFHRDSDESRRMTGVNGNMASLRPLGISRSETQQGVERSVLHPDAPQQMNPEQQRGYTTRRKEPAVLDDGDEYEQEGGKHILPIVIIVLLVIAALVLSLLLIPNDMSGPLGDIKRGITGLFSGGEEKPAAALGFSGEVNRDTAPYQITFHVTTTTNVTDVRIVNERGEVMDSTLTVSIPNTDNMLHVVTMSIENEYQGEIYLQIFDGEAWLDTELKQQLSIGSDMKLKISETSSTTLTAGATATATADASLTAGSAAEPTVSPAMEENDLPVVTQALPVNLQPAPTEEAPVVMETPAAEPTGTPVPTETPSATPVVTPTPTMALTPTPTVRVTATPTAEPTLEPTAEPTAEPTPVPTATPVPTPEPTAKLEAAAGEGVSTKLVSNHRIYKGTRRVDSYQRDEKYLINMPAGNDYLTVDFGVTTFRGNAFRMNAASGTVENPTAMTVAWKVPGGKLQIKSGWRYGFGLYSQPAIVKWTKEFREIMPLNEGYTTKRALKEVIISGQDGKVYFLDLEDGSATRSAIDIGYALRGAPSVNPLGYPVLAFGQFSNKLPNKTSKTMGLYVYNLVTGEKHHLIDTLDDHAYYTVGAMDTSALFDRNSNTLIAIGTNGMLYTEKLSMKLYDGAETEARVFEFGDVVESVALVSFTKDQRNSYAAVESSLAMYGSYAFYADMDGILRCVDTTTMTTVWAVDTGDAVRAAVALDLDEEKGVLWLYTANTISNRSKNGNVTIRRYNAMTGELSWELPVHSLAKYSGQKDVSGKDIIAGAVASPIVGQHELGDMVYFTLSSVSDEGFEALGGAAEKQPSVLIAINKADGSVAWTMAMDAYSYSSPVAVYSEAGEGWVIQCCSNGTVYLLDGLTGEVVNTLQVAGVIEGSPAVYDNMLVFGTTGKENSYVYAIKLQ